jgi:hypothetical protein
VREGERGRGRENIVARKKASFDPCNLHVRSSLKGHRDVRISIITNSKSIEVSIIIN